MKELSIEQKAKAYDEIIKKANKMHSENCETCQICIEELIPELKESEDESIRKALIEGFKVMKDGSYGECTFSNYNIPVTDIIAWLEKQGEQETAWSKEDEEIHRNCICAMRASACGFPEEEKFVEQVDNWFKSLKDRVQPQPKQEWSEEDENNILFLTSIIEKCFKDKEKITLYGDTVCANFTKEDVIDRLKSLRPQNKWKPSEEQMKALESSTYCQNEQMSKVLFELYQDLKKLKGG